MGRARTIPNGIHIHQSVLDRIHGVQGYKPKNLPQQHIAESQAACELAPRPAHSQPIAAPPKRPLLRRPSIVSALALLAVIGIGFGIGFIGVHDQFGVRQMQPQLVAQADAALAPFGAKADTLRAAARFIAERSGSSKLGNWVLSGVMFGA